MLYSWRTIYASDISRLVKARRWLVLSPSCTLHLRTRRAMAPTNLILLAAGVLLATWYIRWRRQNTHGRGYSFPPGPKPWPIIGNLLDVTPVKPYHLYADWAKLYGTCGTTSRSCPNPYDHFPGPIIYLKLLQTPLIIISSAQVVSDLLEKRSALYSDRPSSVMDEL